MSTPSPSPTVPRPSIVRTSRPGVAWRNAKAGVANALMVLSVILVLIPLVFVVVYVFQRGLDVMSVEYLTESIPIVSRRAGPGIGPAIVGTLLITGAATAMAVPIGVLGGIYLNEYGRQSKPAVVVRFLAEVMTGVPSIVMGLFIYTFWVLRFEEATGFAGALALASLMLPVVIRTTEEMLKLVPNELREASYGLGGRQLTTIGRIVLPHAVPGITSGALLAVARAAGETAPLLFTIGITYETNTNLFEGTNTALPSLIFRNATSPFVGAQERAWAAALTLIVIVLVFTVVARLIADRFSRRFRA